MQAFKYFSSVEGRIVTRFPSLRSPVAQYIGARREGKKIIWNTDEVVAVPQTEFRKFRAEYRRALRDKSLVERDEKAYKGWLAKRAADDAKAEASAKKASESAQATAKKVLAAETRREKAALPTESKEMVKVIEAHQNVSSSVDEASDASNDGDENTSEEQQNASESSGSAQTKPKGAK